MDNDRNLLFVDTETTGLNPNKGEIIELAAILTDSENKEVLEILEVKFRMEHPELAEKKALEVNGYNDIEWALEKCASDRLAIAQQFLRMMRDAIPVGHNVSFDIGFIEAFLGRLNLRPTWHYHKIDTVTLARPLIAAGRTKWLRLGDVCQALGIVQDSAHRAMADVTACREVYSRLMPTYTQALRLTPSQEPEAA